MSENKTGKYFKYAVGEILLVMVSCRLIIGIQTELTNKNAFN